jgi:hypothetical protein
LSTREIFDVSWVLPLQKSTIDDMTFWMPNDPIKMIEQQYGPKALTTMKSRSQWISHQTPFEMLQFVWTSHPIKKNKHVSSSITSEQL